MLIIYDNARLISEPYGEDHQYDYAYAEENDLSNRRRTDREQHLQENDNEIVLETVDNPYYGVDDSQHAPGNEGHPEASNVVNVKVIENPYYEM